MDLCSSCSHGLICAVSVCGCKSLTNSRVHKQTEGAEWNQNIKLLGAQSVQTEAEICWDISIWRQRQKQRQGDGEGEGLAKYKHHACSIMAKSSHTHTLTHKSNSGQDYSHLSPLSFTQLTGKVLATPPKHKERQKRDQGSKSPLTGSMVGPGGGQWCSAMTGPCLGLNRNMWCRNEKKAPPQKKQKREGKKKQEEE